MVQARTGSADSLARISARDLTLVILLVAAPFVLISLWFADVIRPGSFIRQPGGRRDPGKVPALIWLASGAIMLLARDVVLQSTAQLFGSTPELRAQVVPVVAAILASLGLGAVMLYLISPRAPGAAITAKGKDIPVGLLCFLIAVPVMAAVMHISPSVFHWLTGRQVDQQIAHETLLLIEANPRSGWTWLLIALVVSLLPAAEELIFRVFLQTAILKAFKNTWLAILITSAVFAAAHYTTTAGAPPAAVLPSHVALGLAAGIAYERTRRLLVPIVMHGLFNAVNIALALAMS